MKRPRRFQRKTIPSFGCANFTPKRWNDAERVFRALLAQLAAARETLRVIRDDFDHDADAHKYGTFCRCCEAAAALAAYQEERE